MQKIQAKGGRDVLLQRLVYELRYSYGYTYLDVCGRTINLITKNNPAWMIHPSDVSPQNAPLVNIENGASFVFSSTMLNLSLQRGDEKALGDGEIAKFIEQADETTSIIINQLGLEDYVRAGFRCWFSVPGFKSKDETEKWLSGLGLIQIAPKLSQSFGVASPTSVGLSVVFTAGDRNYRVAFNGVEQQLQVNAGPVIFSLPEKGLPRNQRDLIEEAKGSRAIAVQNAKYAALIDVDVYIEDPGADTFVAGEYINSSLVAVCKSLNSVL